MGNFEQLSIEDFEWLMGVIRSKIRSIARSFGFDIIKHEGAGDYPPDFSELSQEICTAVSPFTMTSPVRVNALIDSVEYVIKNEIDGAFVECGVWKGGSAMAMALTLKQLGVNDREIYLYDTFSGMTRPGEDDVSASGKPAFDEFSRKKTSEDSSTWCLSPLDEVKENLRSTGYPLDRIHFIQGKVEDTLPEHLPGAIAILRLDTDWYESTKHELTNLFPLLQKNGVLIIDDYGYWQGARKAVDEYIAENNLPILLNRLDHPGRICVKTSS